MAHHSQECKDVQRGIDAAYAAQFGDDPVNYGAMSVLLDFDGPVYVFGCPACARAKYRERQVETAWGMDYGFGRNY